MPPKRRSKKRVKGGDSLSLAKARLDRRKRQSFSEFKETLEGTTYTVSEQTFNDWGAACRFAQATKLSEKDIRINKVILGRMKQDEEGKVLYVNGMIVCRSHTGVFTVQDYEEEDDAAGDLISVPADFVRKCRKWKDLHDSLPLHLLWVNA